MELRDYGIAVRRYWKAWAVMTVLGLLVGLTVVLVATPTYQARAQVFVASTDEGTSGSQFVNQRVQGYPQVALSRTVLDPVIQELGLDQTLPAVRARVAATNPPNTSQIDIVVSDSNGKRAADTANAIARRFVPVVEGLERPARGGLSPVALTVTDSATIPTTPVFPDPLLLLLLGGFVGMALGIATAVVRSRTDPNTHDGGDVRAAWADRDVPEVLTRLGRRARGRALAADPVRMLSHRLEALGQDRPAHVVVVSPSDDQRPARALIAAVRSALGASGVPVAVAGGPDSGHRGAAVGSQGTGVVLSLGAPTAPAQEWRQFAATHAAAVVALEPGRTRRADLHELHVVLAGAGLPVLAVVIDRFRHATDPLPAPGQPDARPTSTRAPAGAAASGRS